MPTAPLLDRYLALFQALHADAATLPAVVTVTRWARSTVQRLRERCPGKTGPTVPLVS